MCHLSKEDCQGMGGAIVRNVCIVSLASFRDQCIQFSALYHFFVSRTNPVIILSLGPEEAGMKRFFASH
ncbi:hypothetical protein BofuT4_uP107120.1 [Botrytis cinerea T4]|uniref:Uncharacterized protein n=1 Tax=Botryotinia fuckeliana (strain T4) TaxID=999810 RepID=G2Y6S6_BOTF4|nr:hypothetical protein BofuT4_uP107120.1 [Botrytis cinerea T4]